MIHVRRSEERGHADHGWLDAYHTFSFANYHDPDFMGFSELRVLNQDRIQPGKGFGTHGHADMEIVTYVLHGVLEHRDSMENGSQIRPGDVQFMSAGTGVTHSEFNASQDGVTELLQMWVLPAERGTEPRYEQRSYSLEERQNRLRLVVDPKGRDGALTIGQDARMYAGVLEAGQSLRQELDPTRSAWLHVARGRVGLNGLELGPGDGAAIRGEGALELTGREEAQLVLWDLP